MNKKRCCLCPSNPRKSCKHIRDMQCKDVLEIKQALNYDIAEVYRREKALSERPPRFKTKPFRPHIKEYCIPMKPSMHTRLRYITHCPPSLQIADTPSRKRLDIFLPTESDTSLKRLNRAGSAGPSSGCTLNLPKAAHFITHAVSNKSIIQVPSPKDSGEVIRAQRAYTKPGEWRPPLPPKSGHDLHKPHSGIYINQEKDFIPDTYLGPGPSGKVPGKIKQRKPKKPCYKGGVCRFRKNKQKCSPKCRKRAEAKRRRRQLLNCQQGIPGKRSLSTGTKRFRGGSDDDSLCGDIPKMEHVHLPSHLRKGALETHSLTVLKCIKDKQTPIHYGILTGTCNMYDNKFGTRSRGKQALTMSAMAYCLAFHYHPKQWTMKLIDNLLDAGDVWYLQCLDKVHDHSSIQGICEVLPFGKKQILVLNGKKMQLLLGEPDIVGYTMSLDPTVYNLCRGLKAFFIENRAGIFLSRVLKVVIWKDRVCYYIFDPAGRDSRAYSNYTNGCAALINVKDLEAVAEVVLSRSILDDQKFVIAPIKVLKMLDEKADEDIESEPELTNAEKAMMSYRLLNENSAIVNANMHLGDRSFEDAKYRQGLPIAIAALSYAKISPPNTWYSKTLDKIVRLGNKLYHDCMPPKQMVDLTIDNIPNEINIGNYCCDIIIYREKTKGLLFTPQECLFNLMTGLKDFFDREYHSGLLDFNNNWLAVWRQKEMFYLFDPYPRTGDGKRSLVGGKACCWMLLNTDTMANVIASCWDFLPETTPFFIHAFKVLKLKKKKPKKTIVCTLSDEVIPPQKKTKRKKSERSVLNGGLPCGDFDQEIYHNILPMENYDDKQLGLFQAQLEANLPDEERMGDIVSLVDSIQEDLVPPVPLSYKNLPPEEIAEKIVNLDSPTVSVTQVVPPWPRPRDKSGEQPEPDPEPEPTPPPTPPTPPPPEGPEEEMGEEELAEMEARKRAEEEEARRKAEELPPPLPPPPPTPQDDDDETTKPSAAAAAMRPREAEEEIPCEPVDVNRKILLSQDAQHRYRLRQVRNKMSRPLDEVKPPTDTPSEEFTKPSNFQTLPDDSQIIRGNNGVSANAEDILPFVSIVAIVTSYKYMIHTWTKGIVNFIAETGQTLFKNKVNKFQLAPVHIIPKIGIGQQVYHACVDVVSEGPTWNLEQILCEKFFSKYDRGMVTTATYSCAVFKRNNLYYLYDGSTCNAMGIRETEGGKGAKAKSGACFMRFRNCRDLVARINTNRDGKDDQHAILSRIMVRRLQKDPRLQLPEDYDYDLMKPKDARSKITIVDTKTGPSGEAKEEKKETSQPVSYQLYGAEYRINGTTSVEEAKGKGDFPIKPCHFTCLVAMLMASMHPLSTWTPDMVDACIEKGLEINEKTKNFHVCEKRVIKNLLVDGKIININIKKILVVNENTHKTFEQYIKAVMKRLRYVIIRFPKRNVVVCDSEGFYHLFDPYPSVPTIPKGVSPPKDKKKSRSPSPPDPGVAPAASWTLYNDLNELVCKIHQLVGDDDKKPEFYTFELTSMKNAPKFASYYHKLSPLFQAETNPNVPYLKRRRIRPPVDEKMYWLNIDTIPWSRMNPNNDLGFPRKTPRTMWKNWDIEFPGDLYSLWGNLGPTDKLFPEDRRGKQILSCNVVALVMSEICDLDAWTSALLDGIVKAGDKYHVRCAGKIGSAPNVELTPENLDSSFDEMDPYTFTVTFNKVIFGFLYNTLPDRFNLSNALSYFFESHKTGLIISPPKNLAFGKTDQSYFMYDCQTAGSPLFCPGRSGSYILKCESLNRLIYVMTIAMNVKRHGQQFHLYSVDVKVTEKS